MRSGRALVLVSILLAGAASQGSPIVSVDADSATAGIQPLRDVPIGSTWTVEVVIQDVVPEEPMMGFDLQLVFDPVSIRALAVTGGDFLMAPVVGLEQTIASGTVDFSELSLGTASIGSGVLARLTFEAIGLSGSPLALSSLVLSGAFGVPIPVAEVRDAQVDVSLVPEPGSALLLLLGLVGVACGRRGRPQPGGVGTASQSSRNQESCVASETGPHV